MRCDIVITHTHTHCHCLYVHDDVTIPFLFASNPKDPAMQTKEKYKRTEDRFYRIGEWIQPPPAVGLTRQARRRR